MSKRISPLPPGSTIGILGGGQLGRMLAMAAAQLGYSCIAYTPEKEHVAGEVCADIFVNRWTDSAAMAAFAQQCDVITWEFENVPVKPLAAIADRLACPALALETAQDRLAEKQFAEGLGGIPAPYAKVASDEELPAAVQRIGTPGILKTRRDGYDGKGQWRIRDMREAEGMRLPAQSTIYEGMIDFKAEFSVIIVRGQDGTKRFWDSSQNRHENAVLAISTLPPGALILEQVEQARALAAQVADALNYVGVLTLEFFATPAGPVFNEMAPRVHNSGHWTIEGAATSQFENHIRAICGLPLGDTHTIAAQVEMHNIIGKQALSAHESLSDPAAHVHLYGKAKAREGRKMGHVTRVIHASTQDGPAGNKMSADSARPDGVTGDGAADKIMTGRV